MNESVNITFPKIFFILKSPILRFSKKVVSRFNARQRCFIASSTPAAIYRKLWRIILTACFPVLFPSPQTADG